MRSRRSNSVGSSGQGEVRPRRRSENHLPVGEQGDEALERASAVRIPGPERLAVVLEERQEDRLGHVPDLLPDVAARGAFPQRRRHLALDHRGEPVDQCLYGRWFARQRLSNEIASFLKLW